MAVVARKRPQKVGSVLLRNMGNGSQDVDGSVTPVEFDYTAPQPFALRSVSLTMQGFSPLPEKFGSIAALTNGWRFGIKDASGMEILDTFDPVTFKKNIDFALVGGKFQLIEVLGSGDAFSVEWVMADIFGSEIEILENESIFALVQDDLTGLVDFRVAVHGYFTEPGDSGSITLDEPVDVTVVNTAPIPVAVDEPVEVSDTVRVAEPVAVTLDEPVDVNVANTTSIPVAVDQPVEVSGTVSVDQPVAVTLDEPVDVNVANTTSIPVAVDQPVDVNVQNQVSVAEPVDVNVQNQVSVAEPVAVTFDEPVDVVVQNADPLEVTGTVAVDQPVAVTLDEPVDVSVANKVDVCVQNEPLRVIEVDDDD